MPNPSYLFLVPFSNYGSKSDIPIVQNPSYGPESASMNDGFPAITMTPETAGGLPPRGVDFNGILYLITDSLVHWSKGLRVQYDSAYATAIGGYPKGTILASDDYTKDYLSLADNNTTNPNSPGTSAYWKVYAGVGSVPNATSSVAGITKIINNLTSTDTSSALTAAQGKVLNDTKLGINTNAVSASKLNVPVTIGISGAATGSAIFDGSGDIVIATTLNGVDSLKSIDGYTFLPNGILMQWGTVNYSTLPTENDQAFGFPIEFPNACLNVSLTRKKIAGDTNAADGGALLVSFGNSSFIASMQLFGEDYQDVRGFTWFAIGY